LNGRALTAHRGDRENIAMTDQPTDGESQAPPPADKPQQAEWLSYKEAAERLGIDPAAVAARARRGRWPKRRRNEPPNAAEVLVPAELLAAGPQLPQERDEPPTPAQPAPDIADAVRAAVGPLEAALIREADQRRALQVEADGLRDRLAASQVATVRANGDTAVERVKREGAESAATGLRQQLAKVTAQLDRLQAEASKPPPKRRWWQF
jgi:hypothetical protein